MDVSHINTNVLRKLLSLTEQKEALQGKLASIDAEIAALTTGKAVAKRAAGSPAAAPKSPGRGKRGRRGALKEQILSILAAAGDSGARVRDIADQLGINPQNIHVWFSSTGKKLAEIARVDAGHYRLQGVAAPAEAPAKSAKSPAKSARGRKAKRSRKTK